MCCNGLSKVTRGRFWVEAEISGLYISKPNIQYCQIHLNQKYLRKYCNFGEVKFSELIIVYYISDNGMFSSVIRRKACKWNWSYLDILNHKGFQLRFTVKSHFCQKKTFFYSGDLAILKGWWFIGVYSEGWERRLQRGHKAVFTCFLNLWVTVCFCFSKTVIGTTGRKRADQSEAGNGLY